MRTKLINMLRARDKEEICVPDSSAICSDPFIATKFNNYWAACAAQS